MNYSPSLEFPSNYKSLDHLESFVSKAADAGGLNQDQADALMLAASEAMTNAIKHGNKLDENKKVTLSYKVENNQFFFIVEDEGDGFSAEELPDPLNPENLLKDSGRGVFLMKSCCDNVMFENGGRRVLLVFELA